MSAYPLQLISSLPAFTSQEALAEHQQATPTQFDLPPVLRRKQGHLKVQLNPPLSSFSELSEGIEGELYILESALVFFSASLTKGISVPYPAIALHAISRQPMRPWQPVNETEGAVEAPLADVGLAGGPCIYCQIDETGGEFAGEIEDEEQSNMLRDLIITPEDATTIETMFEALSACASLFPSPLSDDEEPAFADAHVNGDAGDGDADESEVGAAARNYLDSLVVDWPATKSNGLMPAPRVVEEHPEVYADADEGHGLSAPP